VECDVEREKFARSLQAASPAPVTELELARSSPCLQGRSSDARRLSWHLEEKIVENIKLCL
jgi:hypothetical protein